MQFCNVQPYIRLAHIFKNNEFIKKDVFSADNRLFYILEGGGTIYADHKAVQVNSGSVLVLPRGTCYRLPKTKMTVIGINFDYILNENTNHQLLHPVFENQLQAPLEPEVSFADVPALNKPLILHDAQHLYGKLVEICMVFEKQKRFSDRICAGLFIAVLAEILLSEAAPQQSENLIDNIIDYIAENYASSLANQDIGKKFGYHPNYLNRLFFKQTGVSMHRYILNYRLSQAVAQLTYTKLSVTEIAQRCGFGDYAYFSRLFKSHHGVSPSQYRQNAFTQ